MKSMELNNNTIIMGDKIFARISKNGKTLLNFVTENVATMKDLLCALSQAMKDYRGLVIINIRNYDRGWAEERKLMLKCA